MKILLIVTGSIAAVKSYDLVSALIKKNYQVTVILTQSAQKFVTAEAMTILTGQKTYTALFDLELEQNIGHIALSRNIDIILIAPATAHIIAQMAHGLCDDLATTLLSASNKPIFIAPAMNPYMWHSDANQTNINLLQKRGAISLITPEYGLMACGEVGIGRMADTNVIINMIEPDQTLQGQHILITAGATIEKIDPVRFISNFSSGKQGIALAEEAMHKGAKVTLILGKISVELPNILKEKATIIQIQSAEAMFNQVLEQLPVDIAICTAAVCDWKPEYCAEKMKKTTTDDHLALSFTKNPDILHTISHHKNRPKYVIGFAAETDNVIDNAKKKLHHKNCDVIYVNQISEKTPIFGSHLNLVTEICKNSQETLDQCSKNMVAKWILERIPEEIIKN